MWDLLLDAVFDTLKLIPFLFLTYLIIGALEKATSMRSARIIRDAGYVGPLLGSLLGAFPQCGFSTMASNFYVGRIITLGTLISIYLSTSDEMLPIMISENVSASVIFKILGMKIFIGMVSGFMIDMLMRWYRGKHKKVNVELKQGCNCCGSVFIDALVHTIKVAFFIFIFTMLMNGIIHFVGEDGIGRVLSDIPVLGEFLAGAVGLIPNCSASVVITQLYLEGIIGAGPMISGLLVSAGVGVLVLFKENKNMKENILILGMLYVTGVAWGVIIDILGVTI